MKIKIKISLSTADDAHHEALKQTGFWGKRAAGCIFIAASTGRVLLAHRSDEVQEPNTWGTWGGACDEGHSPKATVLKEIREETGYLGKVKLTKLAEFRSGTFRYQNYAAVVAQEFDPILNWENKGCKWIKFGKWPKPLHPGMKFLLAESAMDIAQLIATMNSSQSSEDAGSGPDHSDDIDHDALQTQYNEIQRSGHGHVIPRVDNSRCRCGGPDNKMIGCPVCAKEKAFLINYNTVTRANLRGDEKDFA